MEIQEIENKIKNMIDDLKSTMQSYGLLNSGSEAEIITTVFLYKFLNDKFMYNLKKYAERKNIDMDKVLTDENELSKFYNSRAKDVAFKKEDTINYLIKNIEDDDFYIQFDNALKDINDNERNNIFRIEGTDREKQDLFQPISEKIRNEKQKKTFARDIFSIISQDKIDFSDSFNEKFDFFASIFEYLAKDYNKDNGANAEYFTPQSCAKIIAKILVDDEKEGCEIYDPSAGSGTLIMHLAHELGSENGINRANIFTQDISQKSTDFLRINLLLNGLTESLHNVRKGDTLLNPIHFQLEGEESSGLKRFDYVVSNPPFKMDFSKTVKSIETKFKDTDRFFAGIPSIPPKDKKKMPIYLMFIQHILFSLKKNGKAAIVVPTGFLTDGAPRKNNSAGGIEYVIRKYLIDNKYLKGVVSMPSNIFATTGTNVSVLFIDKSIENENIVLIDASKLGIQVKEDKKQRTILTPDDENHIIANFRNHIEESLFSTIVTRDEIIEKKYNFNSGQYFDVEIKYEELSNDEFNSLISNSLKNIKKYMNEDQEGLKNIESCIKGLKYDE